jgi:hypothetical protein
MMRDPHVVVLFYRLETDSSLIFDHPKAIDHDINECTLRLADGMLTCKMKGHYATAAEARAPVDLYLRNWELAEALSHGRRMLWFTFDKAGIIDRDPPPPGIPPVIQATSIESVEAVDQVTVVLTQPHYPEPPTRFTASPDVETLWRRYEGYVQGREPLPGMAYVCQSFIEKVLARGRPDAAKKYHIEREVLRTLGNLHSHRGDLMSRRKLEHEQDRHEPPLTPQEITWMETAVRMLIRRLGEHAADPTAPGPMLSMRDLPPLSDGSPHGP